MVDKSIWIVFLVLQVSQVSSFWFFPESASGVNSPEQHHFRFRREQKINCENLEEGVLLQDIIDAECTYIRPARAYLNFIITDEPQLRFINNTQLTSINIRTANHLNLKTLDISDNPKLETIKLAAGPRTDGAASSNGLSGSNLKIQRNDELNTIDMEIEEISPSSFLIGDNLMLEKINLGPLLYFWVEDFNLFGNIALGKFELPKLQKFSVNSALIKKNDKLSTISFKQIAKAEVRASFVIDQNKNLTEIEMDYSKVVTPNLRVRGNPKLPKEALAELDKIQVSDKKDIQEVGECIFDDKFLIKDFTDLEDCQIISSALKFTNSTTGAIGNTQLKTINGDVDLAGLCIDRVNFLETVTISGTIKSDVCNLQLPNHAVNSPNCSEATCAAYVPPSTTTIATTITETIAQTKNTPSEPVATPPQTSGSRNSTGKLTDSGKNMANTGGSSNAGIIGGAVAGGVIVIILIIILVCCCVPIGKVKLYKKVLYKDKGKGKETESLLKNTRKDNTKKRPPLNRSKDYTKSTDTASQDLGSQENTPRSGEVLNGGRSGRHIKDKPKFSIYKLLSKKVIKGTGSQEPTEEVTGTPLLNEQRTPRTLSLESVSARAPSEHMEESATGRAPTDRSQMRTARRKDSTPVAAKGPERFVVTKDGEVLRQPRTSYQHEFLNKMEDFLGNEENYADVIEEVKSDDEQNNSKKGNGSAKKKDHRKK